MNNGMMPMVVMMGMKMLSVMIMKIVIVIMNMMVSTIIFETVVMSVLVMSLMLTNKYIHLILWSMMIIAMKCAYDRIVISCHYVFIFNSTSSMLHPNMCIQLS